MSSGLSLSNLMPLLIAIIPGVLANVAGLVVASTQLTRSPRPAGLVLAGCGINLFAYATSILARILVFNGMLGNQNIGTVLQAIGFVSSLVFAIGLGMIISAAFVDRVPPRPPEEDV